MPHVVTERCVDCRYTDCCTVCPVDCFYETKEPAMLVIDPAVCIDCGLCVTACPIQAIWPIDELPAEYADWTEKNAALVPSGANIKTKKDALPGALSLAQLQARERERGWNIVEPSACGADGAPAAAEGGAATAEAAPAAGGVSADAVLNALAAGRFKWRTARGIAAELGVGESAVQAELAQLVASAQVRQFANTNPKAPPVYGAVSKVG